MIRQRKMTRAAFTLLELFVLVPIIVILAGAGGYILTGHPENAKKDLPKAGVANPEKEVQAKRTRRGDYPADFGVLLVPGPGRVARRHPAERAARPVKPAVRLRADEPPPADAHAAVLLGRRQPRNARQPDHQLGNEFLDDTSRDGGRSFPRPPGTG